MAADNRRIKISGKGFLDSTSGLKVLHIRGSAYERGYQHGWLLAEEIATSVPQVLGGASAVISKTINCSFETAQKKLALGKQAAEPLMPEVFGQCLLIILPGEPFLIGGMIYDLLDESLYCLAGLYPQFLCDVGLLQSSLVNQVRQGLDTIRASQSHH